MRYRIGPLPLCLRASSRTWQQATTVLFQNSAIMSGKTKKQLIQYYVFRTMKTVFIVFPLMMSLVALQRVMMAGLVRELAHRHKAMPSAQKRKAQRHQQRGFSGFCLSPKFKIREIRAIRVQKENAMENSRFKISQYACAVLLIVSSIALVSYQVVMIDDVSNGLLVYIAQAFLLVASIFGLDYYVKLINRKLYGKHKTL